MSKSEQNQIAAYAVTEITTAPSTLEGGKRSPERASRLLNMTDKMGLEDAISFFDQTDSKIAKALGVIKAHHTLRFKKERDSSGKLTGKLIPVVDEGPAEFTWGLVRAKLKQFANQEGGQALLNVPETAKFLSGVRRNLEEFAGRATS